MSEQPEYLNEDIENESAYYGINSLAENQSIEKYEEEVNEYENKREQLAKTKITKQTWSVLEIYQKIKDETIVLNPEYQRNIVWDVQKQTAFIESLFMGIVVPPIYVVEVPGENILDDTKYEVVDGKQRLTSIQLFISSSLKLNLQSLEYYADRFGNKTFEEISEEYQESIKEFLSQVLDVYVITSNSPVFTKYDIFSRLNKGSVQLTVNEIRRAVYQSELMKKVDTFIKKNIGLPEYNIIFTENDKKRYHDYGAFYRSIAMYVNTNIEEKFIEDYRSRPREMINNVLEKFQKGIIHTSDIDIEKILEVTLELLTDFNGKNRTYLVDALIKCVVDDEEKYNEDLKTKILEDEVIRSTLEKSPSTTSNVNKRLQRTIELYNMEE